MIETLLGPFFLALFVSLIATPPVIFLARKIKLVDDPKTHKHPAIIHKKPLPRAGGLPIYLAIISAILFFLPLDKSFIAIIYAGLLVTIIGLLDDKYDLSPYVRFLGNILAASMVVFYGVDLPFITNPLGGIVEFAIFSFNINGLVITPATIFAIIWIVWVMNMLNWSKGVDGQMPGVAAI